MTVQDLLEMIDKHSDPVVVTCFLCGVNWANEINGILLSDCLDIYETIGMIGHISIDDIDWVIEPMNDCHLQVEFLLRNKEG